jgi:hypothetical protein
MTEDRQFINAAATGQTDVLEYLDDRPSSEVLVQATIAAADNGRMNTLKYLLQIAPEGELNERAFLNAVRRGAMDIVEYMVEWYGIEYKDVIDDAFEVADPRNTALIQYLTELERQFVERDQEEYEEEDEYEENMPNNRFIRQVLESTAVDRPIVSEDMDERTDAITTREIPRNGEYIICANPQKAHPYTIRSYLTWCRRSADCRHCPQCRLAMIPQPYLNRQGYGMPRRW